MTRTHHNDAIVTRDVTLKRMLRKGGVRADAIAPVRG